MRRVEIDPDLPEDQVRLRFEVLSILRALPRNDVGKGASLSTVEIAAHLAEYYGIEAGAKAVGQAARHFRERPSDPDDPRAVLYWANSNPARFGLWRERTNADVDRVLAAYAGRLAALALARPAPDDAASLVRGVLRAVEWDVFDRRFVLAIEVEPGDEKIELRYVHPTDGRKADAESISELRRSLADLEGHWVDFEFRGRDLLRIVRAFGVECPRCGRVADDLAPDLLCPECAEEVEAALACVDCVENRGLRFPKGTSLTHGRCALCGETFRRDAVAELTLVEGSFRTAEGQVFLEVIAARGPDAETEEGTPERTRGNDPDFADRPTGSSDVDYVARQENQGLTEQNSPDDRPVEALAAQFAEKADDPAEFARACAAGLASSFLHRLSSIVSVPTDVEPEPDLVPGGPWATRFAALDPWARANVLFRFAEVVAEVVRDRAREHAAVARGSGGDR